MPDVHPITIDELGRLGVDENNRLYWEAAAFDRETYDEET